MKSSQPPTRERGRGAANGHGDAGRSRSHPRVEAAVDEVGGEVAADDR